MQMKTKHYQLIRKNEQVLANALKQVLFDCNVITCILNVHAVTRYAVELKYLIEVQQL